METEEARPAACGAFDAKGKEPGAFIEDKERGAVLVAEEGKCLGRRPLPSSPSPEGIDGRVVVTYAAWIGSDCDCGRTTCVAG